MVCCVLRIRISQLKPVEFSFESYPRDPHFPGVLPLSREVVVDKFVDFLAACHVRHMHSVVKRCEP